MSTPNSNRQATVIFQSGKVHDFYTAMDLYVQQYREELAYGQKLYRDDSSRHTPEYRIQWQKELEKQSQGVAHIEEMVREARRIYVEIVEEACLRAAALMRERRDNTLNEIADATASGRWSELAL